MKLDLKIEKNIPLPNGSSERSEVTQLMMQMEVGDSIFFPVMDANQVRSNYLNGRKSLKFFKYSCRHEKGKGTRVWRIA